MVGWTIITAKTDDITKFVEYCSDEIENQADAELETGTIEGNAYVALRGGRDYSKTLRAIAENCPVDCDWLAVVQNNDTQPEEHLWLYASTDPQTHRDAPETNYIEVDEYHQRVAELFQSKEAWDEGRPVTSAYGYAESVYGIEPKTRV